MLLDQPLGIRCRGDPTSPQAHGQQQSPGKASARLSWNGSNGFSVCTIFALLHKQPYDANSKRKYSTGLVSNVLIPDTVTFRAGYPEFPCWYLSSQSEPGTIKRKHTSNVTPRNILDVFTRKLGGRKTSRGTNSGIIAVLVSDAVPKVNIDDDGEDEVEEGAQRVEYLDEVLLRDFLDRRAASFNGILQKWVEPKGESSSTLTVEWSEEACEVWSVSNLKALSERRCPMQHRACTFDGPPHLVRREAVGTAQSEAMSGLSLGIAKHAALISDGGAHPAALTTHWKVRSDGRVLLLWVSSARPRPPPRLASPRSARPFSAHAWPPPQPPLVAAAPLRPPPPPPPQQEQQQQQAGSGSGVYVCPVSSRVCAPAEARHYISYAMIAAEWRSRLPAPAAPPPPDLSAPLTARPASSSSEPRARSRRSSLELPDAAVVGGGGGGGAGRVPELLGRLEGLGSEGSFEARCRADPAFLATQLRVADHVARHFAPFAHHPAPHPHPRPAPRPSSASSASRASPAISPFRPLSSRPATARARTSSSSAQDAHPPGPVDLPRLQLPARRSSARRSVAGGGSGGGGGGGGGGGEMTGREAAAVRAHVLRCEEAGRRRQQPWPAAKAPSIGPVPPPQPPPLSARRPPPSLAARQPQARRAEAEAEATAGPLLASLKAAAAPRALAALAAPYPKPPNPNHKPQPPGPAEPPPARAAAVRGKGGGREGAEGGGALAAALAGAREREGQHRAWLAHLMSHTRHALALHDPRPRPHPPPGPRPDTARTSSSAEAPPHSARAEAGGHRAGSGAEGTLEGGGRLASRGDEAAREEKNEREDEDEDEDEDEETWEATSAKDDEDEDEDEDEEYGGDEDWEEGEYEEEEGLDEGAAAAEPARSPWEEEEIPETLAERTGSAASKGERRGVDEWTVAQVQAGMAGEGEEAGGWEVHSEVLSDLLGVLDPAEQSLFLNVLTHPPAHST